jgi:hypothetical protein
MPLNLTTLFLHSNTCINMMMRGWQINDPVLHFLPSAYKVCDIKHKTCHF